MQQLVNSHSISEELQDSCEAIICVTYGGAVSSNNEVQYNYFCSKSLQSHQLPPCQNTLNKQIQRTNYQASIWKAAYSDISSPHIGNGWFIDGSNMTIDWMDALPVPLAVLELLNCRYVAQRNAPVIDVHVSRISSNALILVDAIQISVGIRSSKVRRTMNMIQTTSLPQMKNKFEMTNC